MVPHKRFESLGSMWLWTVFVLLCEVHQVQAQTDGNIFVIFSLIIGAFAAAAIIICCVILCKRAMCPPQQNRGRTGRYQGRPMAKGRHGWGGGHTAINMTGASAYVYPHHGGGADWSNYAGGFDTDCGGGGGGGFDSCGGGGFSSGGCDSGGGGGGGGGDSGGGGGGGGCD